MRFPLETYETRVGSHITLSCMGGSATNLLTRAKTIGMGAKNTAPVEVGLRSKTTEKIHQHCKGKAILVEPD